MGERITSTRKNAVATSAASRTSRAAPLTGVMYVSQRLAAQGEPDRRVGERAQSQQRRADHGQPDQPPIRSSIRPHQAPERERAGEQHVADVRHDPVQAEGRLHQYRAHCGLGRSSCTMTRALRCGRLRFTRSRGSLPGRARPPNHLRAGAAEVADRATHHHDVDRQIAGHSGDQRPDGSEGPSGAGVRRTDRHSAEQVVHLEHRGRSIEGDDPGTGHPILRQLDRLFVGGELDVGGDRFGPA